MYQLKWGERKYISQNVRGRGGFLKELEGRDFGSRTVAFVRGLVLGKRLRVPNETFRDANMWGAVVENDFSERELNTRQPPC